LYHYSDLNHILTSQTMSEEVKVYRPEEVKYSNGIETNIYGIAEQICRNPPQYPCSIQLIMDNDLPCDENGKEMDFEIFEMDLLKTFSLSCIQVLFGTQKNPMQLSEAEMDRLNAYMHSIGYHIKHVIEETETTLKMTLSFQKYAEFSSKSNPLEHLRKSMAQ
jgi:hypothetical protein